MTEPRDSAFAALLAAERAAYAGRIDLRVAEIEAHLEAGHFEEARRAAHKLSGSAGTYGFPSLSNAAREIEETLDRGDRIDASILRRLHEARTEAQQSARRPP
jgi:HPt (histidine-containing phosphotransfer) domain-containing protein